MSDDEERRDDPLSVCCRHLAASQHIIEAKNAEIARLRLTDEERDELTWVANAAEQYGSHGMARVIRGLLERTKGADTQEGDDE